MTDYYYQSRVDGGFPGENRGGDAAVDADDRYAEDGDPRPTEAGDGRAEADEPLWYEDRVRLSEADDPRPAYPAQHADFPEDPEPPVFLPAVRPGFQPPARWDDGSEDAAWAESGAAEGGDAAGGWETPARERVYVPGTQAAAARAAAESGERNIRFDPTKERGAAYYDRAARHSRRVTLLKIALPTIAALSVAGFFLVMSFDGDDPGLPALTLSGIDLDAREITMDKPRISGFEGTKRAYEVTAAKATQELGNAKVVALETIDASFGLSEDVRANLVAKGGVYDGDTQKLGLSGNIELVTTNGYAAELDTAEVDIENGSVFSDTGVLIYGRQGSITADSIEVLDRGKRIFFKGDVKVRYDPDAETGAGAEQAGGPAATSPAPPGAMPTDRDGST